MILQAVLVAHLYKHDNILKPRNLIPSPFPHPLRLLQTVLDIRSIISLHSGKVEEIVLSSAHTTF
jgi:hypothetical protein